MKHLVQKELIQLRRNTFLPRLIFMFPIMILCVMPWVMDMEVKNIRITVVDNDRSTASQRLMHRIEASRYFIMQGTRSTYSEALSDIERSRSDVVMVIPQHLERDITKGSRPQILIAANAVNGTKGAMGAAYLANIVSESLNSRAAIKGANSHTREAISTLTLYNKHQNYKVFMIPALMSILMMMLCGFLPALNIVGEKEQGTIEQINVTPVGKTEFILAKLIPYWLIGMAVLTICFILSWLVYGIVPEGSILTIYLISILLALVFSGMGLIISCHSDTMQQAIFVIWFFVVCMMLLSGMFTPIESMPQWAQGITLANPIRYYIDAMRAVFVRGASLADIAPQTITLSLMALIMCTGAVMSYKKNG